MVNLTKIKIAHTIIWFLFNIVIWYMLYAVISNKIDNLVWIGMGIIVTEGLVLLLFKMQCPLTIMARQHSNSTKDNFDIFLPNWLAKHNQTIYTSIFILIVCLLIYRLVINQT